MGISSIIIFLVCGSVYLILYSIVPMEAWFWSFMVFISLMALMFVAPNKNLVALFKKYNTKKGAILLILIWSGFAVLPAPGNLIEKMIRWFCVFILFFATSEVGITLVKRNPKIW